MAEPNPKRARKAPAPPSRPPAPAALRLPSLAMLEGCLFGLPTPGIKEAMKPVLDAQKRSMFIYLNKKGERSNRSKDQNGVGYEPRWQGDGEKAKLWSVGELGINVLDVTDEVFPEDYVFKTHAPSGAITICRGNGEPFAGYSPLKDGSGVAFYNIAHPFCGSALTKNNDDRPKANDTGGTGSFNQGMKQATQNLYAGGIKTDFHFYGWDQNDPYAHYRYEWKYSNREPKDLQLKINSKAAKAKQECDFPILFQTLKFIDGATPEKLDRLNAMVAKVFSSMQRVYTFAEADGIVLRSPIGISLYTRTCYKPLLEEVVGHPIELAQGFLVNCGKRFTAVTYDNGSQLSAEDLASVGGLIMDIPGKGVPGDAGSPIVIYNDEQRKVVLSTAVKRIGDMVISLVRPTGDDGPLVRENRPRLMEHLAGPLLFGKTSELFGAAKGKLISDMLCAIRYKGMMWALQRELLRTHLRALHPNDDDVTFQRKLDHEPIVHSGNPRRAAVLAHILDTYQVPIRHDEVHQDVYRTTNLQAAEERACDEVFNGPTPPPKLHDGLRELADFVLGKETQLACLPVPEEDSLRGAIVPFYHHNEGINVHQAVMWDGDETPAHYVKSICKLAVVGIQTQMVRADAVLDALKDPDCADLDVFYTCMKILELVRGMDLPEDDDDDAMEEEDDDDTQENEGEEQEVEDAPPVVDSNDESSEDEEDDEDGEQSDDDSGGGGGGGGIDVDPDDDYNDNSGGGGGGGGDNMDVEVDVTPPFEAGTDALDADANAGDATIETSSSGTIEHVEPRPQDPSTLTHVNQVRVKMHGEIIYVPKADGVVQDTEVPVPEGFDAQHAWYESAREQVKGLLGFGRAIVSPTWSPEANWDGITMGNGRTVLINLAAKSHQNNLGQIVETLKHEMAHVGAGCACGHNLSWVTMLHRVGATMTNRAARLV